ncbi:hypothetical protein PTSG_04066 [Salpingoeca rosetta]|uniref:hydroxyacylglutathione hydrolase n=1 Tax=Salpingoeca rosetta (strain ATCC 50818 / BSB-021) TaxID=946362 RepID=F2U7P2_SALR5|nr:uncharacterized protein PTSG_04066 [Salpingoeca rosetta]EGD83459.1 hypothetical protein PTSG_04066 [Salpingoeca rosetta]|eukprot:XP_004994963.1 hypothetical protein PTSG_04066 [Salpingoeca rosetta]
MLAMACVAGARTAQMAARSVVSTRLAGRPLARWLSSSSTRAAGVEPVRAFEVPCGQLSVTMLPALQDNYMFLLTHKDNPGQAVAVDSGDAHMHLEYCKEHGLDITHLLTTHHHYDHCDGNTALAATFLNMPIVGGDERIPKLTHLAKHGKAFKLFNSTTTARVIRASGHTVGQVAFFIEAPDATPLLFSGDSMFSAGCGRLFEGTPDMMFQTMLRFRELPPNTLLFPGHEYTVSNLKFALAYAEEHRSSSPCSAEAVQAQLQRALNLREKGQPTVPTTLAQERTFNPFFAARSADELAAIRAAKDSF